MMPKAKRRSSPAPSPSPSTSPAELQTASVSAPTTRRPGLKLHGRSKYLLVVTTLLVFVLLSLTVLNPLFWLGKSRRKRVVQDEDALPDPSGLASWKLIPNRPRMRLKANFQPRFVKEHAVVTLPRQVITPYTHAKTGKRTFGCLRDECRGLAMEDLTDRKWRMLYKSGRTETGATKPNLYLKVTLLLTDGTEMTKLEKSHPELYNAVQKEQEGRTYIECLEGADAIGGNKGQQLRTKQFYVDKAKVRLLGKGNSTKRVTKVNLKTMGVVSQCQSIPPPQNPQELTKNALSARMKVFICSQRNTVCTTRTSATRL